MSKLELIRESLTMNCRDYQIQSLKDNQQYDNTDLASKQLGISSATWPLFGIIWPSSIILASTVAQLELGNKRVLEIGCGIAFSSIVLHSIGINITASDYHPQTKKFLDRNIRNNNLPPIHYQTGNWNTANPVLGEFDLIIGSDVLYEPDHAADVANFINNHAQKNIEVIIVDPGRSNQSRFTRNMHALGYSHYRERFNMMDLNRKPVKGHILYYQRNTNALISA